MIREICKGLIQGRFVPATLGYSSFQVVRNDGCRYSADIMKGMLTNQNKVFFLLTAYCFDIRQLASTQNGHKYFHSGNLASFFIRNAELFTSEVHIQFIACLVFLVHHRVHPRLPLAIIMAKLAVAVP